MLLQYNQTQRLLKYSPVSGEPYRTLPVGRNKSLGRMRWIDSDTV